MEREIKRLFKVLNTTTTLFPIIRSAIAGAYLDDDGVQCVVTLVYMNNFRLLGKSIKKRYSAEVRRAWYALNTDCGKPLDRYHIHQVRSYHLPHQRFEFVEGSKVLRHLEDHSATYERVVAQTNLFGVAVKTLRDLSVLDEVVLAEDYGVLHGDKITLTDGAYLKHIAPQLCPFFANDD